MFPLFSYRNPVGIEDRYPLCILYANFLVSFQIFVLLSQWFIPYSFPSVYWEWLWPSSYPSRKYPTHCLAITYASSKTLTASSHTYPSMYKEWLLPSSYPSRE